MTNTINNRLNTIMSVIAKPLTEMAKAGIVKGRKTEIMVKALETLKTEHDIQLAWTDFLSPFTNGGKPDPQTKSTSSPEQYTAIKACFAMAMNQTEQVLVTFDLKAYQKELSLTNAAKQGETGKAKAYRKKARNKKAAINKLGSLINDFKGHIKTATPNDDTLQDKLVKRSDSFIKVFSDDAYKSLVGQKKTVWLGKYRKLMSELGIVTK